MIDRRLPLARVALAVSLCMATTACLDGSSQDIDETTKTQAAVTNHEVRVRRILGTILDEGGDEIFLTASQASGAPHTNVIRPACCPDYWRFDDTGTVREMDQHVGTIIPGGLLIVNLQEQDASQQQLLGTIDFQLTSSGVPRTVTTPTGQQIGTDDGMFVVRFTGGVRYDVWFQVL